MAQAAVISQQPGSGPDAQSAAVALEGVKITFDLPDGGTYQAVDATDLAVRGDEFVAIVGPTGCGKSTLLNAAAGLLKPASGTVAIFGEPLSGLNRQAGYLFQQDSLMPWKTALENVAIGLEVAGVSGKEARDRAREWLGKVGLGAFGDRYPHMLSGGQRKRVGLAQVLIRDPKIIFMDEPFGPLDAQTRQIMGNLLLDLWSTDRKAVRDAWDAAFLSPLQAVQQALALLQGLGLEGRARAARREDGAGRLATEIRRACLQDEAGDNGIRGVGFPRLSGVAVCDRRLPEASQRLGARDQHEGVRLRR